MTQFSDDKPIWRQIYDMIAMRVLSGQWQEEERAARAQLADERLIIDAKAAAEAAVKASEAAKAGEAKEVQPVK